MEHRRSLGYLAGYGTFSKQHPTCDATVIHPIYLDYDPLLQKVPVPLTHGYVRSTWTAISKQFKMFDREANTRDLPMQELKWARDSIIEELEIKKVFSTVLNIEEVEWNFKSSNGFGFNEQHKTKGRFLQKEMEEVQAFWDLAHTLPDVKMLWKVSGKEEYLPFTKIHNNDQRCFEIPPILLLAYGLRLCQSFNKRLYRHWETSPIKVGVIFQKGGFDRLANYLRRLGIYQEGDVRKWDKSYLEMIRILCMEIRRALYRGSRMSASEYGDRLKWFYSQCTQAAVILPWLQVVLLFNMMCSGDPNTTTDNSLGHLLVLRAYIKYHVPGIQNYRDVDTLVAMGLYSDDHINAWIKNSLGAFLAAFDQRREFYALCGFELKESDDKVQETLLGMKFLGATFVPYYGMWAPQYDLSSIWSRLVNTKSVRYDPTSFYQKCISLLVLSTFNGVARYNEIREFVLHVVAYLDEFYKHSWHPNSRCDPTNSEYSIFDVLKLTQIVPVFEWSVAFWLGLESDPLLDFDFSPSQLDNLAEVVEDLADLPPAGSGCVSYNTYTGQILQATRDNPKMTMIQDENAKAALMLLIGDGKISDFTTSFEFHAGPSFVCRATAMAYGKDYLSVISEKVNLKKTAERDAMAKLLQAFNALPKPANIVTEQARQLLNTIAYLAMFAARDGFPAVENLVVYRNDPNLSEAWNKLMHALNGNIDAGSHIEAKLKEYSEKLQRMYANAEKAGATKMIMDFALRTVNDCDPIDSDGECSCGQGHHKIPKINFISNGATNLGLYIKAALYASLDDWNPGENPPHIHIGLPQMPQEEKDFVMYALREQILLVCMKLKSHITSEEHNREMHALNGNRRGKKGSNATVTVKEPQKNGKKETVKITFGGQKPSAGPAQIFANNSVGRRGRQRSVNRVVQQQVTRKGGLLGKSTLFGSELQRVLRNFAAPGLDPPLRFSSAYTTAESVVASPFSRQDLALSATAPPDTEAKKAWAFAFREPTRALIVTKQLGAADVSDYDCYFVNSDNIEAAENVWRFYPDARTPIPIAYLAPSQTDNTAIHGPYLATGKTRAVPNGYILWQDNMLIKIKFDVAPPTSCSFVVEFLRWSPDGEVNVSELVISGTTEQSVSFSNFNIGYVRMIVWTRDDTTNTIADYSGLSPGVPQVAHIHVVANTVPFPAYAQQMLPHYADLLSSAEKIRINAYSFMFTNTTPQLTRGGTIVSRQTPGDEPWYEVIHGGFQSLASAKGSDQRIADNGVYMFARPTDPQDFAQLDDIDVSGGDVLCITFDLDLSRQYLAMVIDYPDTTTRGYYTFTYNVEFLTDNSWFNPSSLRVDSTLFERAVAETRNIPQFHENPLHLSDIWNTAKKVAGGIMKYGPTVMRGVEAVAPYVAALL